MSDAINEQSEMRRYELTVDGCVSGFIEYYPFDHVVIVTHTEVNAQIEGSGHGSELARQALEFFRNEKKQVVPVCGFFAHYIRKHPDYVGLVTPESRRIFNI